MKNLLTLSFLILMIIIPTTSFGAYNDAVLTTDAIISVGGYSLNVQGASSEIQSIVVDTNSFDVTVLSGSSFSVSSATGAGYTVSVSGSDATYTVTCSTPSILTISPASGTSVATITPTANCSSTRRTVRSSGGYLPGYGPKAITPVSPVTPPTTPETKFQFLNNLKLGMIHLDVKELQKYLNTHGFPVSLSGFGSQGNETNKFGKLTREALIKFQKANNITPAVGFFGSITRGVVNK